MIWGSTKPPFGTRINSGNQLSKDLILLYLLNEMRGDRIWDYSGNNVHGTFYTDYASGSGWFNGIYLYQAKTNQYVKSDTINYKPTNFTFEMIQFTQTVGNYNNFCGKFTPINWSSFVYQNGAGGVVYCGTDLTTRFTGTELPAGTIEQFKLHHIVVTISSGFACFYKNGILKSSKNMTAPTVAIDRFMWSDNTNANQTFYGYLIKTSLYKRALSAAEVLQLYREPYCMFND